MLRDTSPVVLKGRVAWLAAAPPKKRGFVNKTRTGRIADEQVEDACSLPHSMDFADAARQPRALVTRSHMPQKTADFGNKESASSGRNRPGSVISAEPE